MTFFFINKPVTKHVFHILTDRLNEGRTKLKNVIKSFEMTLNSKHRTQKIKSKNQRYRNMKNQNTERRKPSITNRIGSKCRIIYTRTEQNNDNTQIMHKIQFRSSFKEYEEKLCASL